MYSTPTLATRFARNTRVLRTDSPLSEDQMRTAAPSVFAEGKHVSRSERYTYIPTIDVLRGLRKEGFEPFMVAQGQSRVEGKAEFTKHMIRMRHAGQVQTRPEASEIILINSHDGASSYQMLAGMFRFVCCNGLVVGDVVDDIRIPHKGNIEGEVIEGAFRVLDEFEAVEQHAEAMKALPLEPREEIAFATAALGRCASASAASRRRAGTGRRRSLPSSSTSRAASTTSGTRFGPRSNAFRRTRCAVASPAAAFRGAGCRPDRWAASTAASA
jgi:hypothetical protein